MGVRHVPRTRRLGVFAALTSILAALMAVITPSAAYADTVPYFCQQNPVPAADSFLHERHDGKDWLSVFRINYWSQVFDAGSAVSGNRKWIHDNEESASPFPFRVSETMSKERSTSVASGASQAGITLNGIIKGINLTGKLDRTVSEKVTFSQTLESTFTIDAGTAKQIEYGIFGFIVNYDVTVYVLHDQGTRCEYRGDKSGNVTRYTPTHHGWQILTFPRINPGGIINPDGWTFNFYNCTTVAVFGLRFIPPDQVIVRQGTRQWPALGQGSAWWYDSPTQLNVTLPCDMQPNAFVSVSVKSANGLETLHPRSIYISG